MTESTVNMAITTMPLASSAMEPMRRNIMKIVYAVDMQKCSL